MYFVLKIDYTPLHVYCQPIVSYLYRDCICFLSENKMEVLYVSKTLKVTSPGQGR
ncbi:hypothetical protein SAMN04488500_101122 [Sporomusa malonica]|uniref:Uncharacterized protein n=1 Tax=Sporomusa malonica TaxID=112901 RepID=A0A1W1Y8X8_9FIRM|nr:hypothetical protein SAMN04488500_101122 [Sporomusa malonica]